MDETARSLFLDDTLPAPGERRALHRSAARATPVAAVGAESPHEQTWDLTRAFITKSLFATFLWLAGGAILVSTSDLSTAICGAALACTAAGIAVLAHARRQLRRALIEREIARGTPRESAEAAAEIELERIAGAPDDRRF